MTTKVHIILGHNNMPVVIEAFNPADKTKLQHTKPEILRYPGDHFMQYVHSGQAFVVREMSSEELKAEQAPVAPA